MGTKISRGTGYLQCESRHDVAQLWARWRSTFKRSNYSMSLSPALGSLAVGVLLTTGVSFASQDAIYEHYQSRCRNPGSVQQQDRVSSHAKLGKPWPNGDLGSPYLNVYFLAPFKPKIETTAVNRAGLLRAVLTDHMTGRWSLPSMTKTVLPASTTLFTPFPPALSSTFTLMKLARPISTPCSIANV